MKRHILGFVRSRERRHSLKILIASLAEWRNRARSRRQLLELDDRMLSDIGLTRDDVLRRRRSAWQDVLVQME